MRTSKKKQVLTTSIVNANAVMIPTEVIDWERFDRNPVLLYDRNAEGHGGVVVGKVVDRERVNDAMIGRLSFMERFEDADIAFEKYEQGVLPYVSIGGYARGIENSDGVFVANKYLIREVSLVKFPANIECSSIEEVEVKASEKRIIKGMRDGEGEIRYLTLSCNENMEAILNASENDQKVDDPKADEPAKTDEPVNVSEDDDPKDPEDDDPKDPEDDDPKDSEDDDPKDPEDDDPKDPEDDDPKDPEDDDPKDPEDETNASANDPDGTLNVSDDNTRRKLPNGMEWHEQINFSQSNPINMDKTFRELNCDAAFQRRLAALNAAFRNGATAADNTPENVETIRVLACSMLADKDMVVLASAMNFTDGVTRERKNGLGLLVECAAGGAAAATLAAADLGIIKYMSLFLEKLLPNNTFMRSIRFVPMSDREGAIFVESGINPATYTGAVTPVNAPRYFYDDIKRTIARQVFSIQPVTFQNADLAVLAYDKQSWGWTIAMDSLMSDVCTYILQVAANTAGVSKTPTTGETVPSSGLFPIEAPNSNINIKGVTAKDIIMNTGKFLAQNYKLENRRVEVVLPSNLFTIAAASDRFQTLLTPQLSGSVGGGFEYAGTRITNRNPVVRYNTTSNAPELDPAMYTDGTVDNDGKITAVTPATTTANHVGAGLTFVEGEIIAGVGTIDVIVMPDPTNYGYTYSGWMSAGATVARQDGKGVSLIVPSVVA